jgi:hypothetical protein
MRSHSFLKYAALVVSSLALLGFDLTHHSVPREEIMHGGPGKDGIPAILTPEFITASQATYLKDEDRVLGLAKGNEAKAYPIRILNWHEIVNDRIGGKGVVITYCPLCGSGIGFEGSPKGRALTFGVSGLLYQSDLLMYDHQTESLWSQIAMEAITGPLMGSKLTPLLLSHTTWEEWRTDHPATLVLSTKTGYSRNYAQDPYLGYAERSEVMFETKHSDPRYHPKEWVLGLQINGVYKAYPFQELTKIKGPLLDEVNGQKVRIHYNAQARTAFVTGLDEKPMPSLMAFWFAWYTFHPETLVYAGTESVKSDQRRAPRRSAGHP